MRSAPARYPPAAWPPGRAAAVPRGSCCPSPPPSCCSSPAPPAWRGGRDARRPRDRPAGGGPTRADAGWYADGTRPGDVGPAVIAGHIDSKSGPAVFVKLDKLRVGAVVEVREDGRWLAFRVTSVGRYPKNAFPTARVYGPTPDAQL